MWRASMVLVLSVLLMVPTTAVAEPAGSPAPDASAKGPYALVDTDGNQISDGLDAVLDSADPSERFDVIATFEDERAAGKSAQLLPEQALHRRYALIPGYFASLNKGQIKALSRQPGVIRVEENFALVATNDASNTDFGSARARADFAVDGSGIGICIPDTGYDAEHEQLDDPGKLGGWFDALNGAARRGAAESTRLIALSPPHARTDCRH
jgi:serine protease AprX